MADTHLISGLTKTRAEILGQIEFCHKELARLDAALIHLDATLKFIAPDIDLATQKPKEHRIRLSPYKNGEVPRMIMDVLRESEQPMATNEIAYKIAEMRGLPTEKDYRVVVKPIHSALQRMRMQNIVEPVGRLPGAGGGPMLWQLMA
jgi:hypothetical protein